MRRKFALLMKSRFISGGMWALSSKIIVAICSLGINAMLARLLSPAEMGVYFLVITWVAIAALLAQLGLGSAIIKLLGEALSRQDAGAARGAIRAILTWALAGAVFMATITYTAPGRWAAIAMFNSPSMLALLGVTAAIVALTSLQNLAAETLRGFGDIPKASIAGGLLTAAVFALALLYYTVMYEHSTLRAVLWANAFALTLATAVGGYWLSRAYRDLRGHRPVPPVGLVNLAAPLLVVNVGGFVLMQADLWILGMYKSQAEVAVYGAASRLAGTLWMLTTVVLAVLAPIIAQKCAHNEKSELQRVLRAAATASALAALPVVAAFAAFPKGILTLVYGSFYATGAPILAILALGLFVNILLGIRGYVLMMTGHQRVLMRLVILGAAVNIVACTVAARYGTTVSVALAAVGANVLTYLLEIWLVRKTVGIWTLFSVRAISTVQDHINRYLAPETKNANRTPIRKNPGYNE